MGSILSKEREAEETKIAKLGRPIKERGSEKTLKLRKQWRDASAKYYKKNRKKILKKSKRGKKK